VAREARARGISRRAHYAHLTVHAVLHLQGHDHKRAAEAARMERMETRILATLGVADPYRAPPDGVPMRRIARARPQHAHGN
jgi:probable rRNA maturation factor